MRYSVSNLWEAIRKRNGLTFVWVNMNPKQIGTMAVALPAHLRACYPNCALGCC